MELQGENYSSVSNAALNIEPLEAPPAPDLQQIDEDLTNMSKVNMSRKKRKLYEAMKVVFCLFYFLHLFGCHWIIIISSGLVCMLSIDYN